MKEGEEKAEDAFQQLRDFMQNDLKIYGDKVIRTYNSFIPLFDYLYHNPKPTEASRVQMKAYHYKAQLFGWYSQSTDNTINALHLIVGKKCGAGFPINEIEDYFKSRSSKTDLLKGDLNNSGLRFILLNLIYVDQMGSSPFNVKFKGNEPHIDHIYPNHMLKSKLKLSSSEVDHIGNFRFIGATDNIRKKRELPASYFSRIKSDGIDISKHLLLNDLSTNPSLLLFDVTTYRTFRERRSEKIWEIASKIVNPEIAKSKS
jgi:hypothetical protein